MDLETMRAAIHEAVDSIFDSQLTGDGLLRQTAAQTTLTLEHPALTRGELVPNWSYTWPDEGFEAFEETRLWEVKTPHRSYSVRLARGTRNCWGKSDRKRVIVFGQIGPNSFYPWTEFVETDAGQFAAPIPNPEYPRKILTSSDPLPDRYQQADVERTDRLFDSITNGPSLRLVLASTDDEDMLRHGYWVARLRKRV